MANRIKMRDRDSSEFLDENYKFRKGNSAGGRKLGKPNKITTLLKNAILEAAAMVGYDGEGMHQLHGYLCRLAINEPQVFGRLLEKTLPMQVQGKVELTTSRKYETMEDLAEALRERGLPPPNRLIDVTPRSRERAEA